MVLALLDENWDPVALSDIPRFGGVFVFSNLVVVCNCQVSLT